MKSIAVTDPDGGGWRVRVAWMPRWRALARRYGGWRTRRKAARMDGDRKRGGGGGFSGIPDLSDVSGDDILVVLAVVVGMIAFGLLFWWVLLPLLLLLVDGAVVIALLAIAIPARVLLRRPWTIEAVSEDREITRYVMGWRRALATRDELAEQLRLGMHRDNAATPAPPAA